MMKVQTRKTAAGTEYWDTEEKKTIFVPAGTEPDFEVTVNPKSMIVGNKVMLTDGERVTDLSGMNTEQLLAFAEENNIEVPGNMKKEETIRNYILEEITSLDK